MAYANMTRVDLDPIRPNTGTLFVDEITMTSGTYSDSYLFPPEAVEGIALDLTGDGKIEVTNAAPNTVKTGSPTWVEWDGRSSVNPAVTAFRVKRTSGTVVAVVSVRTKN